MDNGSSWFGKLLWFVLGLALGILGIEYVNSKKSGKTLKQQIVDDYSDVKKVAKNTLEEVGKKVEAALPKPEVKK